MLDSRQLLLADDGAHVRVRVELVADPQGFGALLHSLDELVVDLGGDEDASTGLADLPLMEEGAEAGAFDGQLHVRVVQDDVGGLAAQFQRYLLDRVGRHSHDLASYFGAAGEGYLVDVGVSADCPAERAAGPGNDVEHSLGDSRCLRGLGEYESGEGGVRRRLYDDGVAHDEGRRNLPHRQTRSGSSRGRFPRTRRQARGRRTRGRARTHSPTPVFLLPSGTC